MIVPVLSCLLVASLAAGSPAPMVGQSPITLFYHENVGIPEATRIKAAEEAVDFSGQKIVGGSQAVVGQYPWAGGLLIELHSGSTSVCGTSLVSHTRAVTAAHCWFDGQQNARGLEIVYGSDRLFSGGTRIYSSDVIVHESYNTINLNNDVAIIRFPAIQYTPTVHHIELASGSEQWAGHWAWAAGFGRQLDGAGISTSQTLHHVTLQVITNAVCRNTYGSSVVVDSTLCIDGSAGRSTCGGDSGGPLAVTAGDHPVLVGITSFGSSWGCSIGFPAGFARVSAFHSWFISRL